VTKGNRGFNSDSAGSLSLRRPIDAGGRGVSEKLSGLLLSLIVMSH
jgi:hypothetical protein